MGADVRVIGIDPSLTGTGLARHDGTLYTVKSNPSGTRLDQRHDRLETILQAVLAGAAALDLVVIEAPSLGQGRQAGQLDRHGLFWLLAHRLFDFGVPTIEVPPATVKKYATGKGTATKPDMRMALYKRAGLDIADDNQVDAWWLRAIGLDLLGAPPITMPAHHRATLDKLDLPIAI